MRSVETALSKRNPN